VITGDVTQVDLPADRISGLIQARGLLSSVSDICFFDFDKEDVVRHRLVQRIVDAYEQHEALRRRGPS